MNSAWESEFAALMRAVLDGSADSSQLRKLERLLATHRDVMDAYVQLMALDTMLRVHSGKPLSAESPSVELLSAKSAAEESLPPRLPPCDPPAKSPVLGFLSGAVDYVNQSRMLLFTFVAVMLSGWFVFQLAVVLIGHWRGEHALVAVRPGDRPVGVASQNEGGLPVGRGGDEQGQPLAWLSGSVGSRWQIIESGSDQRAAAVSSDSGVFWPIGTEFKAGRQVKLVTGLAEITFRSGAKAVLAAPVQFSVVSPLAANLQLGKLSARVPHTAAGFTVSTPAGSVVDLGTEFGVEVTPERTMEVEVFVGQVAINSSSERHGAVGAGRASPPGKPCGSCRASR